MQNKIADIDIELKTPYIKIVEQKINNYGSEDFTTGYKIKNQFGEVWLSSDQFNILFMERGNLF